MVCTSGNSTEPIKVHGDEKYEQSNTNQEKIGKLNLYFDCSLMKIACY